MTDRKSKVSVIVPVYNVENYLKRCVDSLTQQSLADIEILLIDDGSTDRSGEFPYIIRKMKDRGLQEIQG